MWSVAIPTLNAAVAPDRRPVNERVCHSVGRVNAVVR